MPQREEASKGQNAPSLPISLFGMAHGYFASCVCCSFHSPSPHTHVERDSEILEKKFEKNFRSEKYPKNLKKFFKKFQEKIGTYYERTVAFSSRLPENH